MKSPLNALIAGFGAVSVAQKGLLMEQAFVDVPSIYSVPYKKKMYKLYG